MSEHDSRGNRLKRLETVDLGECQLLRTIVHMRQYAHLDGFDVQLEAVFSDQEFLNIFSLITLELNDLSHLTIGYDGTIAGELLLDHLEDLLLIELLGESLNRGQSLTTISLLDSDVDVILPLLFLGNTLIVVGLREGV